MLFEACLVVPSLIPLWSRNFGASPLNLNSCIPAPSNAPYPISSTVLGIVSILNLSQSPNE